MCLTSSSLIHKGHIPLCMFILIPFSCCIPVSKNTVLLLSLLYMIYPSRSVFLYVVLAFLWHLGKNILFFNSITSVFHCLCHFRKTTFLLISLRECYSNIMQFLSQLSSSTSHTHITLLPLVTLFCKIFYIQTCNMILYNLSFALSSPTVSLKVHLSKSIGCTIQCTH
jgi:hypothetical protein